MQSSESANKNKVRLNVDLRLVVLVLLLVIAGMLLMWKPWANTTTNGRTITVSGEATITAEPDEFTFSPNYEFKNAAKDVALDDLSKKSDEIVKKLKELGVASSKIKINSDGYDYYYFDETASQYTYTLRPTVIVSKGDLVQKVQDYLVSTSPSGQISPQAGFSKTMQKTLESKARDEATKDARAKADQSAKNLGFKVSKVKSVDDGNNFGSPLPYLMSDNLSVGSAEATKSASSLAVQPGENELTYTVTVVYYIR